MEEVRDQPRPHRTPRRPATGGHRRRARAAAAGAAARGGARAGHGGSGGARGRGTRIAESNDGGLPLAEHLARILDGKVVFVPGMDGTVVLSQRGGDFVLDVGQDVAIGYSHHSADTVTLYLEESFAFHLVDPDAAF